jgi:hypothetical protein
MAGIAGVALRPAGLAGPHAGVLIALRVDASVLIALRINASVLIALRVDAGKLIALCRAGLAGSLAGITRLGADITRVLLWATSIPCNRENRWGRTLRAQPNVEIELVNRLRACRRDILDICVPPDGDLGRLMAGEWRFVGRYRLRHQYAGHQKFGIIVQLRCQVEALVSGPVALARQSNQDNSFLCRLRWIRPEALNQRMLRQFCPRTRSSRPASAFRFIGHFNVPQTTAIQKAFRPKKGELLHYNSA